MLVEVRLPPLPVAADALGGVEGVEGLVAREQAGRGQLHRWRPQASNLAPLPCLTFLCVVFHLLYNIFLL